MDGGAPGSAAAGGAGPAPFLLKTYEMVDDASTDAIVSWSASRKSFVVWNPPEFAAVLLPSYFKHNNFSSFIRQLNTYGFRKIDPERWEFANDEFIKDQKHLLKNIYRRKPIHSHSQQPQGSIDPERASFEEEIDKLSREKALLDGNISGYKDQQSAAKSQLENLTPRLAGIEQRQEKLLALLEKAVRNPEFVERLSQKLESMDFSAYNKKRRVPQENEDFSSNKLRLELSPAVSDVNFLSRSTQSSNEDLRTSGFELSDTGESLSCRSPKLRSFDSNDESDAHISCLLNLTLASSPLELDKNRNPDGPTKDIRVSDDVDNDNNKKGPVKAQKQVNDVFWEQFLTERPGCSENEEASSSFRGGHSEEHEERKSNKGVSRNTKGMEHLTL